MSFIIINIIIHVALPLHFFSLFKSCCNLFSKLQKNVCTCSLVCSYVCNILYMYIPVQCICTYIVHVVYTDGNVQYIHVHVCVHTCTTYLYCPYMYIYCINILCRLMVDYNITLFCTAALDSSNALVSFILSSSLSCCILLNSSIRQFSSSICILSCSFHYKIKKH